MSDAAGIQALSPVAPRLRIASLDAMRGLAILGILAVNASAFSLPFMAYGEPALSPFALVGANAVARWAVEVFFEQKFLTLFALLFGASLYLVGGERSDAAHGRLLRRRLFWLAVIGLIHGLALWYGDVLLLYAWSGLFVMLMRSMSARRLIAIGLAATLVMGGLHAVMAWLAVSGPEALVNEMQDGAPGFDVAAVQASIAAYRSGWGAAMGQNLSAWLFVQGMSVTVFVFSTIPLMMLGMGLFKSGFFGGQASTRTYLAVAAVGATMLALLGGLKWIEVMAPAGGHPTGGLADAAMAFPILITLGYASLIILLTTRGLDWATAALRPVGRMAFTNYLTQTLIMTTLFYMPWGPRLFGQVDYVGQWGVVVVVWALQLIWSPLWLARFSMGPLEWVWRCLTYGRRVPILKQG